MESENENVKQIENVSDYLYKLPKLEMTFKKLEKYDINKIKFPDIKYTDELTLNNGKKLQTYEITEYEKSETEDKIIDEKKYEIATFVNNPSLLKEYIIYKKLKSYSSKPLSMDTIMFTILLGFFGTAFYGATGCFYEIYNPVVPPLLLKLCFVPLLSGLSLDIIRSVQYNIRYRKFIKICSNKETELSKLLQINDVTALTREQVLENFNQSEYRNIIEIKANEKAQEEKEITETEQKLKEYTLKQIELQEKLQDLKEKEKTFQRITFPEEYFFYTIDNHKKIKEEFLEKNRLKYIDLILFKFDNVDIRGIDFRDTNAIINPQKVYNKDISGCNFDGIDLGLLADFNGVNITGTSFNKINGIETFLPPNIDEIAFKEDINQKGRNK